MKKSVKSLYINSKLSKKNQKTIPFTTVSKRRKYVRINLTKEVKRCAMKTVEHWWKKLKMKQINEKISHVHGSEKLILLKCSYHPKQSTDSLQSLSKF